MNKFSLLTVGLFCTLNSFAQDSDPVLMRINGKQITRAEFEYSFNKNNSDGVLDKKNVKDYVPLFVDFKLKVAAAEEARIDTLPNIKRELEGYKEQLVMPTLVDNDFIEKQAKETYNVPEHYEVAAILPVGYPSEEAHPSRLHDSRKPVEEIAFYNKF